MTAEKILLRRADEADIPALAELGRDSFVAKFGDLYAPDDLEAFLKQVHSIEGVGFDMADPQQIFAVTEREGELTGYCKIASFADYPEYLRGSNVWTLRQLYTAPALTGQGIGARLMDWAMGEFRAAGADEAQLSVWSGNEGAQRFYARYGFTKIADIDFYVGDHRDDEFLYALML